MKKYFKDIDKNFITEFTRLVRLSKSIIITSHVTPDDDAIASVLASYYYLINYLNVPENKVAMLYTADKSKRWEYFANYKKIKFVGDLFENLDAVDLIIALDGSTWDRFSRKEKTKEFDAKSICIDHHPNPKDEFDLLLTAPQYSSTSEILYRLFLADKKVDKKLSEILLMGILADIGDLRYVKPQFAGVMDVIKALVLQGEIFIEDLKSKYESISPSVFKIFVRLINNYTIAKVGNWPSMMVTTLSKGEINKGNYKESDMDEARNLFKPMLKQVKGVPWGFVIQQKDGYCGISFRSIPGSVNVRIIVEKMGIGGGHDRAAAGNIPKNSIKDALDFVFDYLKNNKPELSR